ncbi:helix-turn-helix transcriptional regulator [Cellulomonas sp. Sa3CUA2]|uniref:Helix-turn-helix transcriptional regulator n=1 Tax=Cellulomonas avistercoris TaxID=2762242 RepID=A0ABR8QHQ4_9CELL|nr:helix-turn-helix domain-containing protein [Cellulomonas avistercoris]MBD7919949.1 helix-turn-helix transcriptional regulator [Cellulomonas avistercoris]
MGSRRSYGSYNDGCAAAHALDLVGDRWTMVVVRELLLGAKRFSEIQRDVIGVGPAVLTQRLHELETGEVLRRRRLPSRVDVYELTEWGRELEAVNTALSRWAVASPALPRDADMSPDTVVLAMRAHARPAPGLADERRVALHLTDSRHDDSEPVTYLATVSAHGTRVERSAAPGPVDAEVHATTRAWKACVIGGAPLANLADVRVTGDEPVVRALVGATSLEDRAERVGEP